MRILAGAAEGEFHHMRLTHHCRQLPAQISDDRALDLEFRRQALGRAGIGREARDGEEILDRRRNALQRARSRTDCKGGIGGFRACSGAHCE
jgi:hypothetical protein